jgi:hypothetical protein
MHLHNSYVKTNVPNRTALVVLALAYRHRFQARATTLRVELD